MTLKDINTQLKEKFDKINASFKENDLFKIIDKEGKVLGIGCFNKAECDYEMIKYHFLLITTAKNHIYFNGQFQLTEERNIVKPTLQDIITLKSFLKEVGFVYNRRTKELTKKNDK